MLERCGGIMNHLYCNKCAKQIKIEHDIPREDFLQIRKEWGFFSGKDGKTQEFLLCENCVEMLTRDFMIPAKLEDTKELL